MYGWFGTGKTNNGLAYIPTYESDPFVCECAAHEPDQIHRSGRVTQCSWYQLATSNLDALTEKGEQLQENIKARARVRAHGRLAFTLQASGYKGSKHPKALERAAKERDALR